MVLDLPAKQHLNFTAIDGLTFGFLSYIAVFMVIGFTFNEPIITLILELLLSFLVSLTLILIGGIDNVERLQ